MKDQKVAIGVIGAGGIADSVHFPSLFEMDNVNLRCVCDIRAQRAQAACEKFGFQRWYSSQYEMMENEELDGVLCLVEPDRMFRTVIECLQRGWNVLMEKPAGISLYQTESIAREAKRTGKVCAVAMNRRHIPLVQKVMRDMRQLTEITQVDGMFIKNNDIADTWNYASAFICDIVHSTDLIRYLAGSEAKEAATIVARHNSPVDNAWSSIIRFENGVTGTLRANYQTGGRVHTFEVHGPGASAFINLGFGDATCDARILHFGGQKIYSLAASGVEEQQIEFIDGKQIAGGSEYYQYYGYKNEDIDFVNAIITGTTPLCSIEDVIGSMQMVKLLLRNTI